MSTNILKTRSEIMSYVMGGMGTFTIHNEKTGVWRTYKTGRNEGMSKDAVFVSLLAGPDNQSSFVFLGLFFSDGTYRRSSKSRLGIDTPAHRGMVYLSRWVRELAGMPESLRIYHNGSCCRCGRELTTPDSVSLGVGPECAKMV